MKIFDEWRPASLENVSWIRRTMARRLVDLRLSEDILDDLQLIVSEIGSNAVMHGRPLPGVLAVRVDIEGADLRIEIEDDGGCFELAEEIGSATSSTRAISIAFPAEDWRLLAPRSTESSTAMTDETISSGCEVCGAEGQRRWSSKTRRRCSTCTPTI